MKKIVAINTKTGEVQTVEKYMKNTSEIWVAGWINDGDDHMLNPELERRAMQTIFTRLDTHDGNIKNLNHRLELQEEYTYNHANVEGFISEVNEDLNKMVQGFDSKIVKIAGFLENFEQRLQTLENLIKSEGLEGSKLYTLQEFDTIIKEMRRQKTILNELAKGKTRKQVTGINKKSSKPPKSKKPAIPSTKKKPVKKQPGRPRK